MKIDDSGCLFWCGTHNANGYAIVCFNYRNYLVSRLICWIFLDLDLDNLKIFALHNCRNTGCINIKHLYMSDQSDNMQDRYRDTPHWATKKTHCKRGHEFTPENIYWAEGHRKCLTCKRMQSKARHDKENEKRRKEQGTIETTDLNGNVVIKAIRKVVHGDAHI